MAVAVEGNIAQPLRSKRNALLRQGFLLAATVVAVAMSAWQHWQQAELRELAHQLQALHAQAAQAVPGAPPPVDFVSRLGPPIASARLAANINIALRDANVQLGELSFEPQPSTAGALRRTDVSLVLAGNYANVKRALNEILARHRCAVLQRLALRRTGIGPELQAKMLISVFAAPALER